jgi:hypothetical protein
MALSSACQAFQSANHGAAFASLGGPSCYVDANAITLTCIDVHSHEAVNGQNLGTISIPPTSLRVGAAPAMTTFDLLWA